MGGSQKYFGSQKLRAEEFRWLRSWLIELMTNQNADNSDSQGPSLNHQGRSSAMKDSERAATVEPISLADAVTSGRQWLRMYAHAGLTFVPDVSSDLNVRESSGVGRVSDFLGDVIQVEGETEAESVAESEVAMVKATTGQQSRSAADTQATLPKGTAVPIAESNVGTSQPVLNAKANQKGAGANSSSLGASQGLTKPLSALKDSGVAIDDGVEIKLLPDLDDQQRQSQLSILNQQVQSCIKCPDLVSFRTNPVFGSGNFRPRLVLMGEAPKPDEDRLGQPMVGQEGELLDKIIAAMKLRREDVYIMNTVKCRPPQNRNPSQDECLNCRPYWRQQLEILQPQCIVCMGAVASKILLQTALPVGRLRGSFHNYRGISVAVTYHPAYLLRTESAKRQTWEDMKMVMKLLGIEA